MLYVRDIQTVGGDSAEQTKRYAVYADVTIRGTLVIDAPCDDVDETNARKVFDDYSFNVEVKDMEEIYET